MATKLNPGPFAKEPYEFFIGKRLFVEHEDTGDQMWLRGHRIIYGIDHDGSPLHCADRLVAKDDSTGREYPIEPYEVLKAEGEVTHRAEVRRAFPEQKPDSEGRLSWEVHWLNTDHRVKYQMFKCSKEALIENLTKNKPDDTPRLEVVFMED